MLGVTTVGSVSLRGGSRDSVGVAPTLSVLLLFVERTQPVRPRLFQVEFLVCVSFGPQATYFDAVP